VSTGPHPSELPPSKVPMATPVPDLALRNNYRQESQRIQRDFGAMGSGLASLSSRTRLVDTLALTLWELHFAAVAREGCCPGRFGRFRQKRAVPIFRY
jgi:hypothetical protein